MKKKITSLLIVLVLVSSFALPFMTATDVSADVSADEANRMHVVDVADILSYDEWEQLEQRAEKMSQSFGCGVYIVTVEDYREYGDGSVYDVTTQLYHYEENDFGVGSERNGIMLLLSMSDRDYALFVYGGGAEYAFDANGQKALEDVFLDDFGRDDWYGGFSDYLDTCHEYLLQADAGDPVRQAPTKYIFYSIGGSLLIALIVCMIEMGKMKSVYTKVEAQSYVTGDVVLTEQYDKFTHITETHRKIEKESNHSRSESGGGGSGRSGKF